MTEPSPGTGSAPGSDTAAEPELPRGLKSKRGLLAGVGVVTAFALVAGPLALARKGDPKTPGPTVYAATETGSRDRDIKPAGASIGDEYQLTLSLAEGGGPAGSWDAACTYVRIVREAGNPTPLAVSVQCTGVMRIGADAMTFQGINSYQPTGLAISKFVVTGGSGTFRDAKGELRVTETGQGTSNIAYDKLDGTVV
ncbi:MAG TPA: hypothetical protein VNC22_06665 [Sporichthya sp.]|nr:hypothetical protein [Sporichthya sp.]